MRSNKNAPFPLSTVALAGVLALAPALPATAQAAKNTPSLAFTELILPGVPLADQANSVASGINNDGTIVGLYVSVSPTDPQHGFKLKNGVVTHGPTNPNYTFDPLTAR
jgi:probable HAF family extracellular repeat protein